MEDTQQVVQQALRHIRLRWIGAPFFLLGLMWFFIGSSTGDGRWTLVSCYARFCFVYDGIDLLWSQSRYGDSNGSSGS